MHEEVVDLVVEVLLLELIDVLPSSVIINLEFVFLNLCLTFGEDLLFLSVQQSSNLCVSNV